jgi:hypothetical protein
MLLKGVGLDGVVKKGCIGGEVVQVVYRQNGAVCETYKVDYGSIAGNKEEIMALMFSLLGITFVSICVGYVINLFL